MSDKPVTLLLLLLSHKCDFGAEPRSPIIATSAVKGLMDYGTLYQKSQMLRSNFSFTVTVEICFSSLKLLHKSLSPPLM
jgi:hypothetical protein